MFIAALVTQSPQVETTKISSMFLCSLFTQLICLRWLVTMSRPHQPAWAETGPLCHTPPAEGAVPMRRLIFTYTLCNLYVQLGKHYPTKCNDRLKSSSRKCHQSFKGRQETTTVTKNNSATVRANGQDGRALPSSHLADFPSSLGHVCLCCSSGLEGSVPRALQHGLELIASFRSQCKRRLLQAASLVTTFFFQCTFWYLKAFICWGAPVCFLLTSTEVP